MILNVYKDPNEAISDINIHINSNPHPLTNTLEPLPLATLDNYLIDHIPQQQQRNHSLHDRTTHPAIGVRAAETNPETNHNLHNDLHINIRNINNNINNISNNIDNTINATTGNATQTTNSNIYNSNNQQINPNQPTNPYLTNLTNSTNLTNLTQPPPNISHTTHNNTPDGPRRKKSTNPLTLSMPGTNSTYV